MSQTNENQRLLNWLESEKKKDDISEKKYKESIIKEIKKINKDDIFKKKNKLTLWQRIKRILLGI